MLAVAKALHQHHALPHTDTQSIGQEGKHRGILGSIKISQ
jgi:hypothetical protein